MAHDLVIRGGTVYDGTGAPPERVDIAVDDGRITRIGDLTDAEATRVIDATGKAVTPGFVDLHTHLDAQVGWDPLLRSSIHHGVTTVLIGNCGVTFAPVSAGNRRYLAELMESVEDISAEAIMDGLPWSWESYGEYLDAVEDLRPALNVVGLVGHSAVRFEVMGDRSMDEGAQPTDEELDRMCELVRRAVAEGAVGFSTSRFLGHVVPDGRQTPGTWADMREIGAIQRAVVEAGGAGGLFQVAPDFQSRMPTEIEMFETGARLGCHVVFSGGVGPRGDGGVSFFADLLGRIRDSGGLITTITHTRPSGSLFGIAQLCPVDTPAWRELMALPDIADRVEALADPRRRARLVAEAVEHGFRVPPERLHPLGLGETPDFDLEDRASLAALADEAGVHPAELLVERLVASEGAELSNLWLFGGNIEAAHRYMKLPGCIPLLGDAGAHVGQICDADSPTFLLSELTLRRGLFSLPEAVALLTSRPARVLGLIDRGEIREGWRADLNVIDLDRLATRHPTYVRDFPHGGGRFIVRSEGYVATVVGGEVVAADGEPTGARPGEVIRTFRRS